MEIQRLVAVAVIRWPSVICFLFLVIDITIDIKRDVCPIGSHDLGGKGIAPKSSVTK